MSKFKKTFVGIVKVDPYDIEDAGCSVIAELSDAETKIGRGEFRPEGDDGLWLQIRSWVELENINLDGFARVGHGEDKLRCLQFHPEMQALVGKKVRLTIEEIE